MRAHHLSSFASSVLTSSSRTLGRAPAGSKVLGTPRRDEHGAALARSGEAGK
jgi:hypothetical protein